MPIEIISKREGFRRCGVPHSIQPTVYPDDRWTPEELQRLKEEPMLMVRIVPVSAGQVSLPKTEAGKVEEKSNSKKEPQKGKK